MTSPYKCQAPECDEDADKSIVIPKTPHNRQEFLAIGLCRYHFDRFEELYEEKWHDFYY